MQNIKRLRLKANLTQAALATMTSSPSRWIQKLESNEINVENITLKKAIVLADALGVDVKDLL